MLLIFCLKWSTSGTLIENTRVSLSGIKFSSSSLNVTVTSQIFCNLAEPCLLA